MSTQPQKSPKSKKPVRKEAPNERTVIALTEFVHKLGGIERAKEAVEALDRLQKAA